MVSWWYSRANKIWLRVLALVVSSVFFFTQVVGASVPDRSFWRERRKSRQKLLASRKEPRRSDKLKGLGKKLEEKDVAGEVSSLITPQNLFTVPSQYGTVKEVHTQATSKKPQGIGNRLIIHIQDAHSSPEAQLNSANILKYLQKGVAGESTLPLLICVEGSSGLVDTILLSSFPEKKIKEKVASEFLKEGKITGEEYFAIIQNEEEGKAKALPGVTIYGVENKRAYEKNLKAFDEGLSSGKRLRNYLQKVREEIKPLKARLYNKRLKELESKIEAYQKKRISLSQYCQYLYRLSHSDVEAALRDRIEDGENVGAALLGRPQKQSDRPALSRVNSGATKGAQGTRESLSPTRLKYPNFVLFVEASKIEKKIDFSRVDSERSKYIKELSKKLTNDELSNLLIMSLDYRLGKVTSGEYYTYLQSLSSGMGKGVRSQDPRILTELVTSKEGKNEYPNLNLYIKYNKLYDRINQNKLFSEISELEEEVKEKLCQREEERKLVRLSRMLDVLRDLTSLKISNEDLAYYHKHHNEITPGIFSNFITAHKLGVDTLANQGGRSKGDMAQERSSAKVVVAGLSLRPATLSKFEEFYRIALNRNKALVDNTISRMEKEGTRVAVLIAGGFHTPGITELLRSRNISYVVVTPRLGESHTSDIEISPRKKRTDFEKAIAGIIGALRAATQLGDLPVKTNLIVHVKSTSKIFKPTELFEELMKKWEAGLAGRPELRRVIDSVELSLTRRREGKAFAIGFARGTNGRILPFVFQCDLDEGNISKVISGKDNCKNFLLSSSFDNAKLTQRDIMAALGLAEPKDGEKVAPDLALVSEHIPVPRTASTKRAVSMKGSAPKVLRLPVAFSKRILSNAAFGNIGGWLHRSRGGLNDLIKNLFDEGRDVTEEFAGERSARAIEGKVRELLAKLDYDDLSLIDKIILILRKISTLGRSGIWNREEFNRKKNDLKKVRIYYLDSGKNLFWANPLRVFGRIFDLLPEGLKNFLSRLVPWRYAAAHYGVGKTRSYVSAGFAREASSGQLVEVNSHEGLHILGFSHRHALKIAREKGISYSAKELMNKLAKEDKKEEAPTPLVDSIYGFLKKLALSILSYINLHPVPSFEKDTTTLLRGEGGRFIHHRGKRPEDAKFVIALSNLWEFTLQKYGQAYEVVGPTLGYESLAENWEQTARGDLQELEKAGFLTIDKGKYRVTLEGKAECLEIRASLLEEEMGLPLSRAWILREAQSNPSPNRERLLERLNAFIDSEIPLEYKRADLRRRLREERARGIEFDISRRCSVPIVRDGMKYWIDEYFLGVDLLELVPDHKNYARVDILREEIVHKLAHSLRDIDTSTLKGLQDLFMEETWATMGELEVEIEVGNEGRKAMLAEFKEWAKSHGVDLDSKIGWQTIESAGHIALHPGLWTRRGGFTVEGINYVGAMLVLNIFQEFDDLKTKLTTRRDLYEKIHAEREKRRIKELFNKRRGDLITFLSRISGLNRKAIEKEMDAYTELGRESIHHIYETFIEEKVAIVDQGDLFKGLDVTTSLKLLNLLSLYARCEKAELIQIRKSRSDVGDVRNCIGKLSETQVLATSIREVKKDTIQALSELATTHEKVAITNSVSVDYKNATSEGIETGGLTPDDLKVQASLMDSEAVTKRLGNSSANGFLSWVRKASERITQIKTVTDDLNEYKDIIFLGAPALAEAIVHNQGIKTEDPKIPEGRRIHFVNNFEGTRFQAMERLPDFSWDDTCVVVVSQGAGDSIQKENLKFLKEKVGTKIAVVANAGNPLLKEAPAGHRLITIDIKHNEGVVSFSGVALALAMSLAGLDYKEFVNRVEDVINDNIEGGVSLSDSAAGKFASVIRGLGLKENHKGELVKTIMMLSYDKAAQYVINAATLSSNQRLAGLRTYFGSLAPEANHNDFQIAMGKNGTLMVLISPDKWPTSQVIPPSAKPRWASTPESQYNTDDFMEISKRGIQTELTEFSDHNISITYKPNLEGLADLVGLIQLASEIDYAVSLECGEIKGKEHDQASAVVREFDKDFRRALITKSTRRPSSEITMSDDMTTIDISGLMGEKESLLGKNEIPDALVAVAKNKLTAQRSHHIGGQHIHLDEPHQAATKDEIKESLDLISLAAEDKKNFIVVGVGGPHNDPKFGVQPLRGFYADELTGKKVLFGGYTLDPTLMKELIDAVDRDPYGTMIMYISSSGETAEPDNTYHILLEHLMKKSKELNLDESAAKQRLTKEAGRIGKDPDIFIAEMEGFAQRQGLTLAQYEFVRDHMLIITGRRGYLNFEAQARGFRRPMHPLSSGRHAIYTLTLYMMKALGMNTDTFIEGGQAYVRRMFLASGLLGAGEKKKLKRNAKEIETKFADVQDELIKLAVKDINKALEREGKMESGCGVTPPDHGISNMLNEGGELEVSSLGDFRKVVNILTEEKWEVEEVESLLKEKALSRLKAFLQRDPGFLAGALMGYIGRHKGRFRVKFVDLTQLLGRAGKWRDKHLFDEGLNKPHISTIAESMETQDILNLLPALADDKESIVVLCEDTNPEDPLKAQKLALSETVKRFLRDHEIPFVVLGSRFNERAHATHILAMMQLNLGYGCTIADPPHGYSPDLQVYGQEKCGKARVAVDVAADKDRGKEPTGIDDVIEQFTLDEELIGIVKTSMTIGQRFFDIIKGKDIIKFWGRPNAQADELVEAASDGIMEALESENILRDSVHSIITIHPITKAPKIERDLNKNGKYVVWVIPCDNLIEGFNPLSPGGNPGSIIVISEVDHPGKPISEQSLNLDNTRMIIEFIHGPSDEPGVMVWGRREMFGHTETAVYSYLKVGDILIPRILKAGSHFTSVPEKKGTDAFNICETQADLPPTVAKIWNNARDTEVRSRDFRSPVGNIAKTVNGGISEFTTNLLEALIHSIFTQGMEGHTIIIGEDGNFYDGEKLYKKGIKVGDIESSDLKAFPKVMFTTGDPEWMGDLKDELEKVKKTGNKDDNKPRRLPDPIWVPDGPLLIPKNQPKLTDFLKKKRFDPDLIRLVDLWTRISVEFGQEYKKTTTLKPTGGANPAAEEQYTADITADKRYHDEVFKFLEDFLFASISEERNVTLYTKDGKYISFCDPVDGVKNLRQGFVTGNIEAITLKDGSDGVSMHFLQGSNILIFEDGENTYCTIWDGNNFRVMYKYEFGKPVPWAIKNIAVGGAESQYGVTNHDARALVDELVTEKGHHSDNATGMLIDIARILERSLPRSFDRKLRPRGGNLGIYDIVSLKETVVGGLLRSGGFLYLDMATARPGPEIVDQGAKMRLTELVALCKEMDRVKGLGYHFGTNKSLQRIIIAHHDENLPKLAYPCFLGVDDDVLKEINRFMWPRYVEQGFASKMQAELPFEEYDVANDPDYEVAPDLDPEHRVYRLKKNPHVGMVRIREPEGWRSYPVHGRVEHLDVAAIFPAHTSEKKPTAYEGKRPEDKDAGRYTGTAPLFGLGIVLGLLVAIVKKWTYLVGLAKAFSSTKAASLIEAFDLTKVETIKDSSRELVPDTINEVSRTFWDRPVSLLQVIVICAVIIFVGILPMVVRLITDRNYRNKIFGLFKRIGDKKKGLKGRDHTGENFLARYGFQGKLVATDQKTFFEILGDEVAKRDAKLIGVDGLAATGKTTLVNGDKQLGIGGIKQYLQTRFGRPVVILRKDYFLKDRAVRRAILDALSEVHTEEPHEFYDNERYSETLAEIFRFLNGEGSKDILELSGPAYNRTTGKTDTDLRDLMGPIERNAIVLVEGDYAIAKTQPKLFDVKVFVDVADDGRAVEMAIARELRKPREDWQDLTAIRHRMTHIDIPSMRKLQRDGNYMEHMDFVIMNDDLEHPLTYQSSSMINVAVPKEGPKSDENLMEQIRQSAGNFAPLLLVKNIFWGTLIAVATGGVIFLLQQFAPHLLPAFLQGEFSFFTILAGILGGIIPVVFLHELGHWVVIGLTDSLKVGQFVWPRIVFRDGKGRLMIGIGRRDRSPLTTTQSLAGPLTGLAAILFAFFSPFSLPVTLGITLTLLSINLSSFFWGDFERTHQETVVTKFKQGKIKNIQRNKDRYVAIQNTSGQVWLFGPQENIVFENIDGFKGLQLTENYLATCNTDNLLTLRNIKTKEVIFENVNASYGFEISEDETLLSTWDLTGRPTVRDINIRSILTGRSTKKPGKNPEDVKKVREAYRYISISIGGDKLAVSINDGNNNVLAYSYRRWEDEFPDWEEKQQSMDEKDSDDVLKVVAREIVKLTQSQKIDKSRIRIVSASLAGPVDEEKGIYGSDSPAANLPFNKYPFRNKLKELLKKEGIIAEVPMCNDAKGSVNGETYSPKGLLMEFKDGGIVIIGGGINIAVKKNGNMYFGPEEGKEEIKEGGHNLYQVEDKEGNLHYIWVGHRTLGRHPIEKGNRKEQIWRKCGDKKGDIGYEYVNDPKGFVKKYPDYPFIEWYKGLRDFEDSVSGPELHRRVKEAVRKAKRENSPDLQEYIDIKNTAKQPECKGELHRALTPEALKGNKVAIQWIKDIASEIGLALAAFANFYQDEEFAKHLVLVSGVNENLGKGVYENDKDKAQDLDIYMKTLRQSAKDELVNYFGMDAKKAEEIVNGIVRSRMTYERELISHQPTDEEVLEAYKAESKLKEGIDVDEMIEGLKSGDPDVRLEAVKKIMSLSPELREKVLGHFASLPLSGKTIFDAAKKIGSPVPAWNIDNGILSRLQIEPLMKAALDNNALVIFEVGATGASLTYPPKGPQLPQYCAEVAKMLYEETKKVVTYPAHLDHLQIPEGEYKKDREAAIQKAVDCVIKWIRNGGTSAAVDTSTLTNIDVKRDDFDSDEEYLFERLKDVIETASIILAKIYELANELGIEIGIEGEVGDVGKELSTPEEAMYYYKEIRKKLIAVGEKIGIDFSKVPWMDVMAIQAGTAHGYDIDENDRLVPYAGGEITVKDYQEKKKGYVFERIIEIVRRFWEKLKILIAIALHGFSGTPIKVAEGLVGKGVAKTNINTDLQSITWKVKQAYNPKLYRRCYDLARDAAIKELEKLKKKEEQEQNQKEKEKLQKKIRDLEIVTSLPFEKSKNRIIYGKWGAPGLRKLFRASEEKPEGWEFLDEIMRALRDDKTVRMRLIEDMTDQELREYGLQHLVDKKAKEEYLEECFYKLELACVPAKPGDSKGLTALEAIHKLTYDRGSALTKAFKLQGSALKVRPVNRLRELRLQQWQLDDIRTALEQVRSRTSQKAKESGRGKGSPLQAAKVLIKLRDEGTTEVPRKEFIKTHRKDFSNRTVDYEISGLRLVGLIDPVQGIVRLAEEYKDITVEELDKMNKAAREIIPKGLDRLKLDDISAKDISVIKEKLASIVRERKILFAVKSFLDGSDPNMSILNLEPLLARVSDSETVWRIIKGARDYAVHLQSESIWSHLGVGNDEITLEDIDRAGKDDKPIKDKLTEVISALTDRIRKLRGHKAQLQASPQKLVQTTGSSLSSFVYVIVAVILGWASTGVAKEIIRNITTQERIVSELGNNAPAWSIYPILAFLGIGILVGILCNYWLKRLEMKDKMMDQSGIRWFKLGIGSWLLATLVGGVTWIYMTTVVAESTFSFLAQKTLQRIYLAITFIVGIFLGVIFNSAAIRLQIKKQRHQIKAKQVLDAIVDKFSAEELEHIIEQIEDPTFEGKVTRVKARLLYDLLRRLKSILDEKGVRNNLPGKFQKKNQIGGLLMLKKALGQSPKESKKGPSTRFMSILLGGLGILFFMNSDVFGAVGEIIKSGQQAGWGGIFGLGLGSVLAFAVAIVGVSAIYQQVSLAGSGIVGVERVRLPQVLGLEAVWQALAPLLEGGQRAVAAIFRQPSKRAEVWMRRWNFPQNKLSTEEIEKMRELIEWVRKSAVKRLWREGRPYWWNPEIVWSSPAGEKAEKVREIERLAESVRERGYDKMLVIGGAKPFAKVAAAIPKRKGSPEVIVLESTNPKALREIEREMNLEKTLFVVSSPAPGQRYEAYEYFYNKLTELYRNPGVSSEEIALQVGRHFVGIVEAKTPFAEEAMKKKFRMIFTEEMGNPYSVFSYSGLMPLALAGVDIEGFVESGEQGRAMCNVENLKDNPGAQLALSLEKMMEAGQEIVLVLPEELRGFGELLQEHISSLWGESQKVILVAEEEFSSLQSYGKNAAFMGIKVGAKESLAIRELKKAGHPVFEVPGKEAMGALFYIAEFGTAFSYLLGSEGFRKPGSAETSLSAEAVVGYGLEKMSPAGAIGTEMIESKALFKHLLGLKGFKHGNTKVFILDIRNALQIKTVSEATASEMNIEFKVRSNGELFKFMGEIVEAAKQAGNPNGVKFAFASNIKNLRKEVIERMLRNSMVKNGLTPDVVGSIVDEDLILDRETPGIVDPWGRISAERVCSFIIDKLLGDTEGNGIDFNIITTDVDAWKQDVDPRMVKKVLWMVLEPAKEGQALATPEGLVVAIEGKASDWLQDFIRSRYPEYQAERLISEIKDGKGRIILPARAVNNREIEDEWDIYKCQA